LIISKLGVKKQRVLLSFMLISAFLSMWMANVAVALLMMPIALSVVDKSEDGDEGFGQAMLLGVAYASTLGGIATLVGTPVNMVFVGILKKLFPESPEFSFADWFKVGFPICLVFLPVVWGVICRYFKIKGNLKSDLSIFEKEYTTLGKTRTSEWIVLGIFFITALGWIFRLDLNLGSITITGWSEALGIKKYVDDATVAIFMSAFLFIFSDSETKKPILTWSQAQEVPWGVIIIVSAGFCIADAFEQTGLAEWMGTKLAFISNLNQVFLILIIVTFIVVLTEVNSNTATANIALPIFASVAVATSVNPLLYMIPVAFASSFGFMMPAGTATNAVVFASEKVKMRDMVRLGFVLNIISIILLTALLYLVVIPFLGLETQLPIWAKK
jgi:solute carrier family 13 (sodium-dependent dicarboxylate transporter), member 2/3/5